MYRDTVSKQYIAIFFSFIYLSGTSALYAAEAGLTFPDSATGGKDGS